MGWFGCELVVYPWVWWEEVTEKRNVREVQWNLRAQVLWAFILAHLLVQRKTPPSNIMGVLSINTHASYFQLLLLQLLSIKHAVFKSLLQSSLWSLISQPKCFSSLLFLKNNSKNNIHLVARRVFLSCGERICFCDCFVLLPQVSLWPAHWWTFHNRCQLPTKRNRVQYEIGNSSPLHSQEPVFDAWTSETVWGFTQNGEVTPRRRKIFKLCHKRLEALRKTQLPWTQPFLSSTW